MSYLGCYAFELRPYDRAEPTNLQMALVVGSGTAFPTFEGARPLLGYSGVLLGGAWKTFVNDVVAEVRHAVAQAGSSGVPLLLTETPDLATVEALAQGYSTSDPRDRPSTDGTLNERRFVGKDGTALVIYGCQIDGRWVGDLQRLSVLDGIVVIKGYPQTLRGLYQLAPDAMRKLGPTSAIVDLDRVRSILISLPTADTSVNFSSLRCGGTKHAVRQ